MILFSRIKAAACEIARANPPNFSMSALAAFFSYCPRAPPRWLFCHSSPSCCIKKSQRSSNVKRGMWSPARDSSFAKLNSDRDVRRIEPAAFLGQYDFRSCPRSALSKIMSHVLSVFSNHCKTLIWFSSKFLLLSAPGSSRTTAISAKLCRRDNDVSDRTCTPGQNRSTQIRIRGHTQKTASNFCLYKRAYSKAIWVLPIPRRPKIV